MKKKFYTLILLIITILISLSPLTKSEPPPIVNFYDYDSIGNVNFNVIRDPVVIRTYIKVDGTAKISHPSGVEKVVDVAQVFDLTLTHKHGNEFSVMGKSILYIKPIGTQNVLTGFQGNVIGNAIFTDGFESGQFQCIFKGSSNYGQLVVNLAIELLPPLPSSPRVSINGYGTLQLDRGNDIFDTIEN